MWTSPSRSVRYCAYSVNVGRPVVALVVDPQLLGRDVVELDHLLRAHERQAALLARVAATTGGRAPSRRSQTAGSGTRRPRRRAGARTGRARDDRRRALREQVVDHRQVVRAEAPQRVLVAADPAEVDPRGVQVVERVRARPSRAARAAGRPPGGRPSGGRPSRRAARACRRRDARRHPRACSRERLLDQHVLAAARARHARASRGWAQARRSPPHRSSDRRTPDPDRERRSPRARGVERDRAASGSGSATATSSQPGIARCDADVIESPCAGPDDPEPDHRVSDRASASRATARGARSSDHRRRRRTCTCSWSGPWRSDSRGRPASELRKL